jgi:Tfp pilus assembly protein PilZ
MMERKTKRIVPAKPITVAVEPSGADPAYGVVINISFGGVCVLTDTPLPLGESLRIELSFPQHHQTVQVPGRTVWVGPPEDNTVRCGVEFAWPRSPELELTHLIQQIAEC